MFQLYEKRHLKINNIHYNQTKPKATFRLISIFPSLDSKDIHLYTTTRRRTITKVE